MNLREYLSDIGFLSGNLKYIIHYFNSLETVTNVSTSITSTTNDIEQDISVSIDTSTNELKFSTTQDTLLIDESKTTATEGILQLFGFKLFVALFKHHFGFTFLSIRVFVNRFKLFTHSISILYFSGK